MNELNNKKRFPPQGPLPELAPISSEKQEMCQSRAATQRLREASTLAESSPLTLSPEANFTTWGGITATTHSLWVPLQVVKSTSGGQLLSPEPSRHPSNTPSVHLVQGVTEPWMWAWVRCPRLWQKIKSIQQFKASPRHFFDIFYPLSFD